MNLSDTVRKIGCSRTLVYYWKRLRQEEGDESLKSKPIPGRPGRLSEHQKKHLVQILLKGALKNGYSTDLWTTRRIAKVIDERFAVSYHPNSIWYFLKDMGWSCQKSEKKARQRNEEEIEHWKKYQWPHIKKVRKTWTSARFSRGIGKYKILSYTAGVGLEGVQAPLPRGDSNRAKGEGAPEGREPILDKKICRRLRY